MTNPGLIWTIFFFVLAIAPLIFIHELGHYAAGRAFGVKVDAFSIGFGREVAGWTDRHGTRWKVGWLPLGGYVRFAGDLVEDERLPKPEMSAAERAQTFPAQPLWRRAVIVAAGPITNFLVAILLLGVVIGIVGEPRTPPVAATIMPGSAAQAAGLRPGDRFIAIDGRPVDRFETLEQIVRLRPGQPLQITVDRGGRVIQIAATPRSDLVRDRFGNEMHRGLLGVTAPGRVIAPVPLAQVPFVSVRYTFDTVRMIAETLWQIVSGQRSARELGGPIKIAQVSGQQATLGLVSFLLLMAMLSVNLGFINFLPVPMLDGGHLMFYAAEAVRGKPVPVAAQEQAYRAGFALVAAFMIFVTVNDIAGLAFMQRLAGLIG